jgi:hypothetical protein
VDDVRILYTDEEDYLAESVLTGGHRRIAICGTTPRHSRQISSVLQLGNDVSMVCDGEIYENKRAKYLRDEARAT